jgi:REP element-mobilizing transposase RayT
LTGFKSDSPFIHGRGNKGATSFAYNHHLSSRHYLTWQDAYGVITVRKAESEKVVRYIANQQDLHATRKTARLMETTSTSAET